MADVLDRKFDALNTALGGDKDGGTKFANNPVPYLAGAGIPLVPHMVDPTAAVGAGAPSMGLAVAAAKAPGEKVTASTHWWGVDIVMNEKLTQDIITGVAGAGSIGTLIGSAIAAGTSVGPVGTVIGAAVGIICAAKVAQIKLADNGNGVHWPITWLQWAALVAAVPTGPAGVAAAGMVFVHPVRN